MTQFESVCPNEHSVKFTLEMCGRTAQCPKCSARFEVPSLAEVREMLGNEIDEALEKEFQEAEKKLKEYAKAKAAKQAQAAQATQNQVPPKPHEFEFECPNGDQVKFTLEMCGHTAKCPKCGVKFDVLKLEEVRKLLGDQIDADIEREFREAEIKYQEYLKVKAAKRAQMEKESREKAEQEEAEKAEKEKAEQEAREKAEKEAREKAEKEKAEKEKTEKEEAEKALKEKLEREEREEAERAAMEAPTENSIVFECPKCGTSFEMPASSAGKKGRCPECGVKFIIPEVSSETNGEELELNPDSELSLDDDHASGETKTMDSQSASASQPKITVSRDSNERAFLYPNLAIGKSGGIDIGLDEAIKSIPEALKMDPMAKFFWTLWTSGPKPEEEGNKSSEETEKSGKSENEEEKKEEDFRANIIGKSIKSSQAGKIEIQTTDGKVFRPVEFYEDKSLSPIGYFEALDENEQPITLVIRWENVVRIVVKK